MLAIAKPGMASVAVIGAGPSGLSMLKTLRDDSFKVTLYERRSRVGGLWAYSENLSYTTALPRTLANISKFTCGFSDYPMPDRFPPFMKTDQFQEFMQEYATHYDLLKDIVFNTGVTKVTRNASDTKWAVEIEQDGKVSSVEYDKVAFCHGYQTEANIPKFNGQEQFAGEILHSQQYRNPEAFKGKRVVVIGLTSTSGDIIPDILPYADKVWVSHRRGVLPFRRFHKGVPVDLSITWRRRQVNQFLQRYLPNFSRKLSDMAISLITRHIFGKLDPAWGLEPFPSPNLVLPGSWEDVFELLKEGKVESLPGIKRFMGPKSVEFADGRVLEDIDAVILCTGYDADWTISPFVETSKPTAHNYSGSDIYRLYMNLFPPAYADSCVMLCYSAFGKNNGFSFADVTSMAISNVWRGVEKLPPREEMEKWINKHQEWVASRWAIDPTTPVGSVKQWEFQGWLHEAAGTGMENLGWGWKGWMFWLKDRRMYNLMNNGVETAHGFRYFETGKRKTWAGARDEIIHQNELVKAFPIKEEKNK